MRVRTIVIAFILITTGAAPALSQSGSARDAALESLVAAERSFLQQAIRGSTQSAFVANLSSTALLYRPRAVRGLTYLRARPIPRDLALVWEPVFADVSADGDLGYTTGPWIGSSRTQPNATPTFGEQVTIWRRHEDGGWKVELNAGIAHGPDAVGPAPLRMAPAPQWKQPTTQSEAALASLLAADSMLAVAASKNGAAAAFQRSETPHVRLLRSGRFPLTSDSANAFLRATPGYTWKTASGGVSKSGDLGYTFGVYAIMTEAGGRQASETGDYVRIWRRNSAGEWRVALDLTSPAS
jgi:ketosteroid isomerase-like protein